MVTALIILSGIGVFWGLKMQKAGNASGAMVTTACTALAIVFAIIQVGRHVTPRDDFGELADINRVLQLVQAQELGRHLAETAAGTQALCVLSDLTSYNDVIREGLEAGLGGSIPVTFVVLGADLVPQGEPLGVLSARTADALLQQNPGTDLLISMVNLPWDEGRLAAYLKRRDIPLAVGNVFQADILETVRRAGVLAAAIVFRDEPVRPFAEVRRGGDQEIFDSQFVLVTSASQ
jgi:hypothetical protein